MSIHLITGSMFSGKTEKLLNQLEKFKNSERILIKHRDDKRFDDANVVSHSGKKFPAITFDKLEELSNNEWYKKLKVIAVDEGHFFPEISTYAHQWALHGKQVLISAIQSDIFMEPLPNVSQLVSKADKISVLTSYCSQCHAKSLFNYRKTPLPSIENPVARYLGGPDEYTTLCRTCFHKRMADDYEKNQGLLSNKEERKRAEKLLKFQTVIHSEKYEFINYIRENVGIIFCYLFRIPEMNSRELPVNVKNTIDYIFGRAALSRAPFKPHPSMIKMENTEYPGRYMNASSWFVGLVKDDCRIQWVLTLQEYAHYSQTCSPSRWGGCIMCPTPLFEVCDLSERDLEKIWEPGSVSMYDVVAKDRQG
jgi:thymidine kinase